MALGFPTIFKKKVSEEKVAELFVNIVFNAVDSSFEDVAELINNDINLVERPTVASDDTDNFLLVIIAGNYRLLEDYFDDGQDDRIRALVVKRLASVYEIPEDRMQKVIDDMLGFFQKINFPSKNIHYAMSKAVFYKYDLAKYQKEYFRNLSSPDPIFLKHLDEIIDQFIIRWDHFTEKYKIAD
ncbi:MAG: hypothetical protein K9J06_09110 [Flavobacteriales bacterium]|nr:hypothetical protein [Flavobacteriales bacterium]